MALSNRINMRGGGGASEIIQGTLMTNHVQGNDNFTTNVAKLEGLTVGKTYDCIFEGGFNTSAGTVSVRVVSSNNVQITTETQEHSSTTWGHTFNFQFTASTSTVYFRLASNAQVPSQTMSALSVTAIG